MRLDNNRLRIILGSLLILFGILLIVYFILSTYMYWGKNYAILLFGIGMIVIGSIKIYKKEQRTSKKYSLLRQIIIIGITGFVLSFTVVQAFIIQASSQIDKKEADYLLVLGAGIRGETLSLSLKYRLDKALEYIDNYPNVKIIVSGGQGEGEAITEAEAMKRYLIAHGIKDNHIIKEEKATSTFENIKYTKDIIESTANKNDTSIMIVTSDYHIFRSKLLAKRLGLKTYGMPSETPIYIAPNCYIREFFAVIKSIIIDFAN